MSTSNEYYIPHKATWPVIGTAGLVMMLAGFANYLNGAAAGSAWMALGLTVFIVMLAGWFTLQSGESES
ncbi:MAG: cytochrome c oxidase subunit 3, partial [Methylobacter sp.]|nr:cytochrome c oxidase subunit 3 [Methylobacter sp.]